MYSRVSDDADVGDDDVEAKGDGSKPQTQQRIERRVAKGCCNTNVASARRTCHSLFCALGASVFMAFFFATIALAVAPRQSVNIIQSVTRGFALPTQVDWDAHVACIEDNGCDMCKLDDMLSVQPLATRVAIVGQPGSGVLFFRALMAAATKVSTTSDECALGDSTNPLYILGCDEPFAWAHSSATYFAASPFGTYKPTHLVLVVRNPFESAMAKFHMIKQCSSAIEKLWCNGREASASDFASAEWDEFAIDSAREWVDIMQRFEDEAQRPKLRVDLTDLLGKPADTIRAAVQFVAPGTPQRGELCAYKVPKPPASTMTVDQAFPPALRAKFCAVIKSKFAC